jgi:hypothetical protein
MISIRKEFELILTSNLDFIFASARPKARPAFRVLPRDMALDALGYVPFNSLNFNEGLSDPAADSFGSLLEEKLQYRLENQLTRRLLDSNTSVAEEQIHDQS